MQGVAWAWALLIQPLRRGRKDPRAAKWVGELGRSGGLIGAGG